MEDNLSQENQILEIKNPNIFKRFVSFITGSRTGQILSLLIILAAVPLTVLLSQQQQEIRQQASSTDVRNLDNTEASFREWTDPTNGEVYLVTAQQEAALNAVAAIAPDGRIDPASQEYQDMTRAFTTGPVGDCITCNDSPPPPPTSSSTTNANPGNISGGTSSSPQGAQPPAACAQFSAYCTVDAAQGSSSCNWGSLVGSSSCVSTVQGFYISCLGASGDLGPTINAICNPPTIPTTVPSQPQQSGGGNLADINKDGKISLLDYNILISCSVFGKDNGAACGSYKSNADLDKNGTVDQLDYNIWLREYQAYEGD